MSIRYIKIYGERNTSTNSIYKLIKHNLFDDITIINDDASWINNLSKLQNLYNIPQTLFIFVVKDLHPWLKAMYYNNYNYIKPTNFKHFINNPLDIINSNIEESIGIFDLRYNQINNYLDIFNNHNINAIMINIADIYIDGGVHLLNTLTNTFNITFDSTFYFALDHYVREEKTYELQIPNYLIRSKYNKHTEDLIEQLKNKNYMVKLYE